MDADNFSIRQQLSRLIPHSFWSILLIVTGCVVVSTLLVFGRLHSEFASEAMRSTQTFKTQIDRLNSLLVLVLDAETLSLIHI